MDIQGIKGINMYRLVKKKKSNNTDWTFKSLYTESLQNKAIQLFIMPSDIFVCTSCL